MKLLLVVALAMAVSASASKITTEQATDIVANTPVEKAAEAVVDLGEYTPPRENRSNERARSPSHCYPRSRFPIAWSTRAHVRFWTRPSHVSALSAIACGGSLFCFLWTPYLPLSHVQSAPPF